MTAISYGNYSLTNRPAGYQMTNYSRKNSSNSDLGTKSDFGTKLINGEYYINVPRDKNVCNYPTFPEVDKIPGKYALKDDKELGRIWWNPGIEYRVFHAAESTEENPVLVARGVDEHGKLFEEKIDVRQIDPYNTTYLELSALEFCRPGENKCFGSPLGGEDLGLWDRFDFITGYQKKILLCNKTHLKKEAAWLQEDMDFLLEYTKGGDRSNRNGNEYEVSADFLSSMAKENAKNLELYSSAVKERMISSMARKCSEELSDMLWKK